MVLFYGLLAFETANNTIAAASKRTNSILQKENLIENVSSSSTNSWIYTEDLRKRYSNHRCIFVPVYVNEKNSHHNYNTIEKINNENSWIYSKSVCDRLYYSTSKISLPLTTNLSSSSSSSVYYLNNQALIKSNKILIEKNSQKKFSSSKYKSTTNSLSSIFNTTNNLTKYHQTNDLVEENDDDEDIQTENHPASLIKHPFIDSSCPTTTAEPSNSNKSLVNTTNNLTKYHQTNDLSYSF
ncbi:unnamed protein product, partial [Rotaria sordida]